MHPLVYAAFPELSSTEVDALLTHNRAHEVLADLTSRITETAAVTRCPSALLEQVGELLASNVHPEPAPFFEATVSLVHEEVAALLDTLRDHAPLPNPREIQQSVLGTTLTQLQRILLRAQIKLAGEHQLPKEEITSRENEYARLSSFLATKHGLRLFQERFPIAVHLARNLVRQRTRFLQQLLHHLDLEFSTLPELGISHDAKLVNISLSQGDSHHGKSVTLLAFSDGSKVVYKPRPQANDRAFARFLSHLGSLTNNSTLQACRTIDRGDHGWAEFIPDDPDSRFSNPAALGAFAAAIQLLAVSDVHFENVRFRDGIPILTDTETLFSSTLQPAFNPPAPSARALGRLVTTSGFFPSPLIVPHRHNPIFVDVGALGQRRPGGSSERGLTVRDPFTSDMRIEATILTSSESAAPTETVSCDFVDAVCESFRTTLQAALSDIPALSAFIRRTFAQTTVRSVTADTIRYAKALELASNAACLSDPELLLAALSRVGVFRSDVPSELLASELKQLAQWDTPAFVVAATGTDLISEHEVVLPNALALSPLDSAIASLRDIDDDFIKLSEWMIRVSFAPYYGEDLEGTGFRFDAPGRSHATSSRTSPRRSWDDLQLGFLGTEGEFAPTWLGARLSESAHQYWYPSELSLDAFAGSSGVALAAAVSTSGSQTMVDEFFRGLTSKLQSADLLDPRFSRGALSGTESALWAADCYAQCIQDDSLATTSRRLLRQLCMSAPRALDVMAGDAGLTLLLTHLVGNPVGDTADSMTALAAVAARLAEGVLTHREQITLTGYAHGWAGIAAALALAAPLVESPDVDSAAEVALDSLLSSQQPETGLWSIGSEHALAGRGWCSGTPGVLLALAQVYSTGRFDDHDLGSTIRFLIDSTKRNCFGGNISLCHGDVGNLWILRHTAAILNDEQLAAEVVRASRRYLRDTLPQALDKPTRNSISHSLMVGTAGAALFGASLDDLHAAVRSPLWLA